MAFTVWATPAENIAWGLVFDAVGATVIGRLWMYRRREDH